jgi:acyl-coenzyme A synthetase/AMP-(fatty) acid ligase
VGSPPIHAVHRALSSRQLPLRLLIAPAEAGPVLFHAPIEDCDARPELLGTPLPDVEPALLDAEGRDVPPGGSGELHVGGPMHFSGYDGAPAVVPGQRVPTGLALRHERDGQFSLLGPLAEAFEANGGWVHPGEVETALLRCAGVQEASVFPVTGADGERRIAAALVMQEGPTRDDAALFAEIEGLLLAPLRPSYLLRQRQLPRDGWGRVDRAALIAALGAH